MQLFSLIRTGKHATEFATTHPDDLVGGHCYVNLCRTAGGNVRWELVVDLRDRAEGMMALDQCVLRTNPPASAPVATPLR
jgi:hypothetical protein